MFASSQILISRTGKEITIVDSFWGINTPLISIRSNPPFHRHTENEQHRSLGRVVVKRPNSFRIAEGISGRAVSNSLLVTNAQPIDSITTGKS